MNLYQRLAANGWQRRRGNSRIDFYRKGKWLVCVPASTLGRVRFWKEQADGILVLQTRKRVEATQ